LQTKSAALSSCKSATIGNNRASSVIAARAHPIARNRYSPNALARSIFPGRNGCRVAPNAPVLCTSPKRNIRQPRGEKAWISLALRPQVR
jgi:hypothetical protein